MNFKRGLDRIAIVLALICMPMAFLIGGGKYSESESTGIKLVKRVIWNDKIATITDSTLKGLNIKPPYNGWTAFPTLTNIPDGTIARKKNTDTFWISKEGQWFLKKQTPNQVNPLEGESNKKYPEWTVSPGGKYIVQGGKWVSLIEIEDEAPLGHQEMVAITFYPSPKKCFIAGLVTSIITFPVILFGFMGLIRIINWIIAGFKQDIKSFPAFQVNSVPVSPCLNPPPQKWWFDSFQYYQVFPLIQEETYGPFYRIGGEEFGPLIGISGEPNSETHCFFTLTPPKDEEEAKRNYQLPPGNPCTHVHKFYLTIPKSCNNAQIYIGPARGGISFQVGINGKVAELVKKEIEQGRVEKSLLE